MSRIEPTLTLERPDVAAFVEAVRSHLADLPVEEQQELTEGLAADLTEQTAEHGPDVLGDPAAYAAELRVAAGFPAVARRRRVAPGVAELLDDAHAAWDRRIATLPGDADGFVTTLRPVWWVIRGWAALCLLLALLGRDGDIALVPSPGGNLVLGAVLLPIFAIGSVQVGRGKLWPGAIKRRRTLGRVFLLGLNLLAMLLVPVFALNQAAMTSARAEQWYNGGDAYSPGLSFNGTEITNVYPYDAQGHPLVGVQLLDQNGSPLRVINYDGSVSHWTNGNRRLSNVFPMPTRRVDPETGALSGSPQIRLPQATLPPVTLDGFVASVLHLPAAKGTKSDAQTDRPSAGKSRD